MGLLVKNDRTGRVLAEDASVADSWIRKALGLMFLRCPRPVIMRFTQERIITLHMFFVFFPIDVVWLDQSGYVVEMLQSFRPFAIHTPSHRAAFVVELPEGTIRMSGTRAGDHITV